MTNVHRKLTKDLLALYIKYGAREFNAAIKELRESNIGDTIADAAQAVGDAVRDSKSGLGKPSRLDATVSKTLNSRERLIRYIDLLEQSGDRNKMYIAGLGRRMITKQVLETTSAIKDYMFRSGILMEGKQRDRYRSIRRIIDYLLDLPSQQVNEQIRAIEEIRGASSSLQKWTDVIVKREHDT
jgi:hypothetical protein